MRIFSEYEHKKVVDGFNVFMPFFIKEYDIITPDYFEQCYFRIHKPIHDSINYKNVIAKHESVSVKSSVSQDLERKKDCFILVFNADNTISHVESLMRLDLINRQFMFRNFYRNTKDLSFNQNIIELFQGIINCLLTCSEYNITGNIHNPYLLKNLYTYQPDSHLFSLTSTQFIFQPGEEFKNCSISLDTFDQDIRNIYTQFSTYLSKRLNIQISITPENHSDSFKEYLQLIEYTTI